MDPSKTTDGSGKSPVNTGAVEVGGAGGVYGGTVVVVVVGGGVVVTGAAVVVVGGGVVVVTGGTVVVAGGVGPESMGLRPNKCSACAKLLIRPITICRKSGVAVTVSVVAPVDPLWVASPA